MQNTSTLFKTKIKEASRQFQCKITIGDRIFTNDDIVDVKIDGNIQPQDGFMIGSTSSTTLDLTLLNKGDTIYSTNQIKVEIGLNTGSTIEYILMGYFNIDDIVKTDYTIKFAAFDNMIKFETPYFSSLGDTATLQQVVNELSSKTGVQFTGSLPSYTVKKLEGFTCREVLGYVASLCGGNALITREGKFTIVILKDINYSIDTNNYFDYKREEVKYKISKVSCKVGDKELSKGALGTDSMELQFENPWVTESILTDIYTKLNGFNYLGYSMKWQGDISLDLGDIVTITDKKGVVRKHPILSQKFNYTGGITVEMGAKGESKNKNSFNSSGSNSNKVNRVVTELLIVNEALINKANVSDLKATNAEIATLKAQDAEIQNALIGKATIEQLNAVNANIKNLVAEDAKINNALINKADIIQLNAVSAKINVLEADSANFKNVLAGNITADNIQTEFLQTLKGWMLEGSIGNAQISDLSANKVRSGTLDTSLVTVAGPGGRLTIQGNKLQVFDNKNGILYERIMLGIDSNNNSSLTLRGADGTTVLLTQDGLTKAGFTDGYNKIDNGSLDGVKLDINSVIRSVNGATEKIESTVIQVGNKTLNVLLQEQTNTITEHGTSLATQEARITANEKAINLKVDTQTYTTDKTTINNSIATTLRDSKAYADTKKSEAISAASTDATTKANAAKDSAVSTAASDATTKANSAKDTAIAEAQKKADKALADSKVYVNQEITTVNSNLSKATSDISVLKGQIVLKVEQSDIDKTVTTVKNELVAKVDGIEVGGRNLIRKTSSSEITIPDYNTRGSYIVYKRWTDGLSEVFPDLVGKTVTFSFDAISPNGNDTIRLYTDNGTPRYYYEPKTFVITTTWTKFVYTTTIIDKGSSAIANDTKIQLYCNTYRGAKFKNFKMELGNKATDWTPAPEDTDQAIADVITTTDTKISNAKAEIKTTTDAIALNVSNLTTKTTTIETKLGDKATKAEVKTVSDKAATIEANLNGITQRVSSTESTLSTHTTQIGTINGTLSTHTKDISTTKQQVSTIETNLGSITTRVSTVENKTTTIDGKVAAQETRLQAAEQKVTPSAIISTISSQLSSTGKIENSVMKFDKNGILVSHTSVGTKTNMGADGFKILREEANGEMTEIGSLAEKSGLAILRATEVYAQNIYTIHEGSITFYVNGDTGDDINGDGSSAKPYKTMSKFLPNLPHILHGTIKIYFYGTIREQLQLYGFQMGVIELIFDRNCVIMAPITCADCTTTIRINGGKTHSRDTGGAVLQHNQLNVTALQFNRCSFVYVGYIHIKNNGGYGVVFDSTRGICDNVSVSGCRTGNWSAALVAGGASNMGIWWCNGSDNWIGTLAYDGSIVTMYSETGKVGENRAPKPGIYQNGGGVVLDGGCQFEDAPGVVPPKPPTQVYEGYWGTTATKSWRDNWGWRSDNNYIYQGQYGGNGNHRGFMYFDSAAIRNALSGATIHAVQLKLTRRGAGGSSAASSIHLYGHGYNTSGGGYSLSTDFGWPGAFAWGESKWISLPTSVGEQLKSGSIYGLAIIGGDYMIFEAYAELWIKYEK